jgi:hypothetical protein
VAIAPVRSRHNLYFVPEYDFATAPHVSRFVEPRTSDGQWAYEASLTDVARTQGDAVAANVGFSLFLLPGPGLRPGIGIPMIPLFAAPVLSLLGAALVYLIGRIQFRRRGPNRAYALSAG